MKCLASYLKIIKSIHKFKLKILTEIKKFKKILAKSKENPIIMGILNITPDSFFDGGKFNSKKSNRSMLEK